MIRIILYPFHSHPPVHSHHSWLGCQIEDKQQKTRIYNAMEASDHPSWLAMGEFWTSQAICHHWQLIGFSCDFDHLQGFWATSSFLLWWESSGCIPDHQRYFNDFGYCCFWRHIFPESVLITDMVSRQPEKKLLQWPAREIQWLGKICGNLWHLWPLKDCNLGRFVTWGGGFCEGLGGLFLEGGAVPMCGSLGSQRFDNEFNWFYRRERLRKDIW